MYLTLINHLLMFSLTFYGAFQPQDNHAQKQELPLSETQKNLYLDNHGGEVTIGVHNVNSIVVFSKIYKDDSRESALDEPLKIAVASKSFNDGWLVYADIPCTKMFPEQRRIKYCCCEEKDFDHKISLRVLVPEGLNIRVSEINGSTEIRGITGSVKIDQVNGDIVLHDVSGPVVAETVNGNIRAAFEGQIAAHSSFNTLNGDISITCPEALSASIDFEAFIGNLYTDFPGVRQSEQRIENTHQTDDGKNIFACRTYQAIEVGDAVNAISFGTFNGNVYLRKK